MNKCQHKEAVRWNPDNKVVQCHRCGQIFEPKKDYKEMVEQIVAEAIGGGSMCWDEPPIGIFDSSKAVEINKKTTQQIINLFKI